MAKKRKPAPRKAEESSSLKARVEQLEAQLYELTWYVGEIQQVVKASVAEQVAHAALGMVPVGPAQEMLRRRLAERLAQQGVNSDDIAARLGVRRHDMPRPPVPAPPEVYEYRESPADPSKSTGDS